MDYVKIEDRDRIAPIFESMSETLIWSCLQGYMGDAWADDIKNPESAQIITGDFCFFSGVPNTTLVRNIPVTFPSQYILIIPNGTGWESLIEQEYQASAQRFMRYSIKKEPEVFDQEKLQAYKNTLPLGYRLKRIDEELFRLVKQEAWSKDLCSQFPSYKVYHKYGLGYVVMYNDEMVSGASSYTVYDKGIEIEIDTKEEYRRKGLALACASALILECLKRGLYPSWDAANKESVALSAKLGYHFDKEYVTYAVKVKD